MPTKISSSLAKRLKGIKLFLCDVDGILTDASVFIGGNEEIKRFNIQDGLGLVLLRRAGIKVGCVSARPSGATRLRAEELKMDFIIQQKESKVAAIESILTQTGFTWAEVCYMGDDVVDLGALKRAGVAVCVPNGVDEAKAAAHYVTRKAGGYGAVREVVEMILKTQNKWKAILVQYAE